MIFNGRKPDHFLSLSIFSCVSYKTCLKNSELLSKFGWVQRNYLMLVKTEMMICMCWLFILKKDCLRTITEWFQFLTVIRKCTNPPTLEFLNSAWMVIIKQPSTYFFFMTLSTTYSIYLFIALSTEQYAVSEFKQDPSFRSKSHFMRDDRSFGWELYQHLFVACHI